MSSKVPHLAEFEECVFSGQQDFVVRTYQATSELFLIAWIPKHILETHTHPKDIWTASLVDHDFDWHGGLIESHDSSYERWDLLPGNLFDGVARFTPRGFGKTPIQRLVFPGKHLKHVLARISDALE